MRARGHRPRGGSASAARIDQDPNLHRALVEAGASAETQESQQVDGSGNVTTTPKLSAKDGYETSPGKGQQARLAPYAPLPAEHAPTDPTGASTTAYAMDRLSDPANLSMDDITAAALKLKMEGQGIDRQNTEDTDTARSEVRQVQRKEEAAKEKENEDMMKDILMVMCPLLMLFKIISGDSPFKHDSSSDSSQPPPPPDPNAPKAAHPGEDEPISGQRRAYKEQLRKEFSEQDKEEEDKLIAMAKPKVAAAAAVLNGGSQQSVPRTIQG